MIIKPKIQKTYFIISDIHNFYDEMIQSLKEKGFEQSNRNHIVICAGDFFDRKKTQAKELLSWIKRMLSQKRLIWIRGNHEELLIQLFFTEYPDATDFHNGTVSTVCQLADINENEVDEQKVLIDLMFSDRDFEKLTNAQKVSKVFKIAKKNWTEAIKKLNDLRIRQFVEENTVNCVELGKYIIVHSFIPTRNNKYFENWRKETSFKEWLEASWKNPFELIKAGEFDKEAENGKVLVFGHWTVAGGRAIMNNKEFDWYDENNDHSMWITDKFIALDATTVLSKKVNVLKLEGKDLI